MTNEHEQRIRELAHNIWESEGCPLGEELRHWQMAERLFEASEAASSGAPTSAPKRSTRAGVARPGKVTKAAAPAGRQRNPAPKGNTP